MIAAAGLSVIWMETCCIPPASMKAVKDPRGGRPLGNRVAIIYSKHYQMNMAGLERMHSFDIRKYAKIYLKLNTDGLLRPQDVFVPRQVTREQILLVHNEAFLESLKDSRRIAEYLESPLVGKAPAALADAGILQAFRYATGGTILAARLALKYDIAINIGGGYHHAKPHAGEGFCVYADMPIAIRVLQKENLIHRALVVDLDVHQGNGTAVCFKGDDSVFAFSMHEGDIYSIPKETDDLDVELAAGADDATYLGLLEKHLPDAFGRSRPDIVFLQAGCDTLKGDPLARLAMTEKGIVARDAMVIGECMRRGIPVVMVLGGGYSKRTWRAQYASIRRTIGKYGLQGGGGRGPRRELTGKEKLYVK